jgi:hypothetical protein
VKAILYEKAVGENGYTHWSLIRQLDNFPSEFLDVSMFPYFFSPDFMYYIDYEPSKKSFLIRHSMTQVDMHEIPQDVIKSDEPMRTKAKKMLFYDDKELIVINKAGKKEAIEKKVSIVDNFRTISSSVIPYFKEGRDHYYSEPDIPPQLDIMTRL